jgi:hypothetical protein
VLCSKFFPLAAHWSYTAVGIDQDTGMAAAASAQCVLLLPTPVRHTRAPSRSGQCTGSTAAPAVQRRRRRVCGCRAASGHGPAAAQNMPAVEQAALAADPAALTALVEDAVVWASQHGLVGPAAVAVRSCCR